MFSLFIPLIEGDAQSNGIPNPDADCGSKNTPIFGNPVSFDYGPGFGITVVGSIIALVQTGLYCAVDPAGYIA